MELYKDDGKLTPRALLGRRLRRARERAELSQRALAELVGYPNTYISRVERNEQLPSEALAQKLDKVLDADDLFAELLALVHEASITRFTSDYVAKEAQANRIEVFTSSVLPGLLQTPEYARETYATGLSMKELPALEQHLSLRVQRQHLLLQDDPPLFWSIVDEAALKRLPSTGSIMKAQLERVLELSELPRVQVQILPFAQAFHPMMGGSLTLLTMTDGTTSALVESFATVEGIDAPQRVLDLQHRFDVARAQALPEAESRDVIRQYLKEYTA
ncbi:helix-turn-helix domain-containing protein [Streptomyces buecherae]|uniref:Helix-turn-helix transcriptional regulator n=1 Tax=Streptomyces buecherae TaxID=2763006 RepID=A0A7H8NC20_9ACTN|nr:helix-turn-helix transcriptional regulator [Streptomyces buecherae]QKW51965.1 helix-turn-helix transcriptional regulator [Streptomyces buecherae]